MAFSYVSVNAKVHFEDVNSYHWAYDYIYQCCNDAEWAKIDPNNVKSENEFRKCLVAQVMQGKRQFTIKGTYGGAMCLWAYDTKMNQISWTNDQPIKKLNNNLTATG